MRKRDFILFFTIVLTIYGLINFYLFITGWGVLPEGGTGRVIYLALFLLVSLSYVAGRILERVALSRLSNALVWMGSFWLGAMVYLLLMTLATDFVQAIGHVFHLSFLELSVRSQRIAAGASLFVAAVVVAGGYINARTPRIRVLDVHIAKSMFPKPLLNIAVASDIHLGTIISRRRLSRIVKRINALEPDLVLLPGDVVDEDLRPVIKDNLGEMLKTISAEYGIIAVTGNHEYIGGVDWACEYLRDHGIVILRDQSIKIADGFYVVGREDISFSRRSKRKALSVLLQDVDMRCPVIVLDHEPFHLEEAAQAGVDLQLSGHTHHGQFWPFNLITKRIYELSWGYKKKENTHIYVSCGVGTWGPPIRLGNRPEIVNVRLRFG